MRKLKTASGQVKARPTASRSLERIFVAIAVCAILLAIAIRIRLLGIPLERDEGEYAYTGQLMLQGIPPYKLAYSMKFPGTAAAYALIMSLFGQTAVGIHVGLLTVNIVTIILIFLLGRRLLNSTGGYVAAGSYAVLSLSPSVLGLASHATHFVVLPVLGGILLLLNEGRPGSLRIFVSGLLFGIGLLMKQPAFFMILFGAFYLLRRDLRDQLGPKAIFLRAFTLGAAILVPLIITCLLLWWAGVFGKFWFWTIDYARQYTGETPFSEAASEFIPNVAGAIGANWPLWILAGFGLLAGFWNKQARPTVSFLLGLLVFSMLAVSYRLYVRNHYFILLLPAISLLAAVAFVELCNFVTSRAIAVRFIPVLLLSAALGSSIYQTRNIFFSLSPVEVCQVLYPTNPFVESIRIAQYLHDQTSPTDQIAVLGSEPEIYFYAHRHSATGYIYTYGLVEGQPYAVQMQREMVDEIEVARPKYLVVVGIGVSWLSRPGVQHPIFNWITDYTRQNYDLVGFVNMLALGRTDYYFDDLPQSLPQIGNRIFVDRKKP